MTATFLSQAVGSLLDVDVIGRFANDMDISFFLELSHCSLGPAILISLWLMYVLTDSYT